MLEIALEAGADDVRSDADGHLVSCPPTRLAAVKEAIEAAGVPVENAELSYVPLMTTAVEGDLVAAVQRLIDALEEHDDVQKVHSNADFVE